MSKVIHVHLYCDGCHLPWLQHVDNTEFTFRQQRRDAKQHGGWSVVRILGETFDACSSECRETIYTKARKAIGREEQR